MDTLLVLGKTGQVALEIERQAASFGYRPIMLGRPENDIETLDLAGRLADTGAVLAINAAAYTQVDKAEQDVERAFAVNAGAPASAAEACAKAGVPFVHISTDYVFDGAKAGYYAENDPRAPLGVYGRSKAAGEEAVEAAGGNWAIVRTAWVYSPFGANFLKTMLRLAGTREEVGVVADQIGCPTAAADVATACLRLGDGLLRKTAPPRQIWHAAGGGEASWADFATAIFAGSAARGGPSARVKRISTSEYPTPTARPANSRLNCAKLEAAIGWRPPAWQVSLSHCLDELIGTHRA